MPRRWLIPLIAILIIIIVVIIILVARRVPSVEVVRPIRRDVVELVIASGNLEAVRQSNVGTEVPGIVRSVTVQEGDEAVAGKPVIFLERGDVEQRVEQAQLAVQTAQTQLEQVRSGPPREQIARAQAELSQARRVNTARLEQARQRLRQLQTGRPEEVRRAEAALRQARASRQQAETDLRRAQQLFARGAVPRADLDRAQTQVELAQANESAAEEQLALARHPASPEEIAAAQADVRAAQATLEESVRIAQESLRELQSEPRPEEVRVAQARLREAQAALRQAHLEAAKRTIRAPFNGLVVQRNVEPGQSVNPGQTLLVIADMSRTEVVVETDETNLPKLRLGQPAILIAPAFPSQPFRGVLRKIGPEVDVQRGVVSLRIRPLVLPGFARPDMTVDANIEVARIPDALSIPVTSLLDIGGRTYVLTVEDGRTVQREVRVLARGEEYAAVEGISATTPVVVRAAQVQAGQKVRVAE